MAQGVIAIAQPDGSVNVRTEDAQGKVSRRVLVPGAFTDAVTFVATDLSVESQVVKDAANACWTPQIVAAWKATHPFIPAPAPTSDQIRFAAFQADANRQAILAALLAATPAQVSSYITTNVTDLPSARAMLIKLALVLATLANQ